MRLLCRDEKNQLRLESFDDRPPPYAALSHLWGKEEVLYSHVIEQRIDYRSMAGYKKIEFCMDRARTDGLKYCWVDTCCIDRNNSSELSEAINSIYQCFREADTCYVYLSDVPDKSFRESRWFTQGWTLQELLAPTAVIFFNSHGERMGDKVSLLQALHERTQIPKSALLGDSLENFSLEEKMSWMAQRQTAYEEDKVYSLLGILGIHMPFHYGEGRAAAERRLQTRILKASLEPAGLNVRQDFTLPFELPEALIVQPFVGRAAEIAQIEQALPFGTECKTVVLLGLGGIGKTQLAIEFAKRRRKNYTAILWIDGRDEVSLCHSFADIARRFSRAHPSLVSLMAAGSSSFDEAITVVKHWLDMPENNRWLMVIDDVEEPPILGAIPRSYDVRQYLPTTHQGHIIITTRSTNLSLGRQIHIRKIRSDKVCLKILEASSERPNIKNALDLIKRLNGIPLALSMTGAYLKRVPDSIAEYLEKYEHMWRKLKIADRRRLEYDFTLETIRELTAMDNLELPDPTQGRPANPEAIPIRVQQYETMLSEHETALGREHPVTLDTMHSLGLLYMAQYRWNEADKLNVQALEGRKRVLGAEHPLTLNTAYNLGEVYYNQGRWEEAEELYVQALEVRKRVLGADHLSTLNTIYKLGQIYCKQDKWDWARKLYVQVFEVRKRVLGVEHPDTLDTVHSLGEVYYTQGRLAEAEAMFTQALEGREKVLVSEHPSTLDTINTLGQLYRDQGKVADAELMFARVPQGYENAIGLKHESTLQTTNEEIDGSTVKGERTQFPIHLLPQTRLDSEDEQDRLTMSDMDSVRTGIGSELNYFPTTHTAIEDKVICDFLCKVPEIRSLCVHAAARGYIGHEQFSRNMVKALKRLYISCRERVQKDTNEGFLSRYQMALKFRQRRLGITGRMLGRIVSESAGLRPVDLETVEEESDGERNAMNSTESDDDFDEPDADPVEVAAIPTSLEHSSDVDLLNDYNKHGEFTELLISLSLKTLPVHLRSILTEAPTSSLCIVDNAEGSFLNTMKVYIEKYTRTQWAWESALHQLPTNETRLVYTCTCGREFARVLPCEVAKVVDNILALQKSLKKDFGHQYSPQDQTGEHLPRPAVAPGREMTPGTTYQRVRNWLTTIVSKKSAPPDEDPPSENSLHDNNSHDKQSKQSQASIQTTDRWIIVGFQGQRSSLEIEHIAIDDFKPDSKFFEELKRLFQQHLPFWKRWLSIWQLYTCHYVQFDKIYADYIRQEAHRWPALQQEGYDFIHWPVEHKVPPISEDRFHNILSLCDDTCPRKRLHACMSLGNLKKRDFIGKMPKKVLTQFDYRCDGMATAWGIHPITRPRLGMVVVYVLLAFGIICAGFIFFWQRWVSKHPDDLQNASVPLIAFLGFIAVVTQITWMVYSYCISLQQVKNKID